MIHENIASYTPDFAEEIDTKEEIAADRYRVSIKTAHQIIKDQDDAVIRNQAETLARVIGFLLAAKNPRISIRTLGLAFGFDAMNGYHSQSEVAKEEGVTRALISHYVVGWRDLLSGGAGHAECLKFRKKQSSRETFKKSATSPFLAAKAKARKAIKDK